MTEHSDEWVCTDCYFAHHYGWREHERPLTESEAHAWLNGYGWDVPPGAICETYEGLLILQWFAGDSDTPCDREPLNRLDGYDLFDNTCSNHYYEQDPQPTDEFEVYDVACDHCGHNGPENGIQEFSRSQCGGCGSMLGGSRYRLACYLRTGPTCEHGCGLCDGPLRYVRTDPDGEIWWECVNQCEPGQGHTSRDCCSPRTEV